MLNLQSKCLITNQNDEINEKKFTTVLFTSLSSLPLKVLIQTDFNGVY